MAKLSGRRPSLLTWARAPEIQPIATRHTLPCHDPQGRWSRVATLPPLFLPWRLCGLSFIRE